ncbi:MAG: HEAT repeat domain-containing protein [Planctomycetes bacterium]|nr:HEAT repeat domain-containing protein [Planctomycetota bacterium]
MTGANDALEKAFEALKGYDWGTDPATLKMIDDALAAARGDAASRSELEARLAAVLRSAAPRAAKDFACRRLSRAGSAACVPALAGLLGDDSLSHMARYALERLPCPEAGSALREALSKLEGKLKAGAVRSLGARRDVESIPRLAELSSDPDPLVAATAAAALGQVGTAEAAAALAAKEGAVAAGKAPDSLCRAAADARLECAERLLGAGKKAEAAAIYEALRSASQPEHVRLAASLGLAAATGKS